MLRTLLVRAQQKHRTIGFPKLPPVLPDRLRGRPEIDAAKCPVGCRICADTCPTNAITLDGKGPRLYLGCCLFCPECERACPEGAIRFTTEHRLATSRREELVLGEKEFNWPGRSMKRRAGFLAVRSNCAR